VQGSAQRRRGTPVPQLTRRHAAWALQMLRSRPCCSKHASKFVNVTQRCRDLLPVRMWKEGSCWM
jgi:hypothetical protein